MEIFGICIYKTKEEKLFEAIMKKECPNCESRRIKISKFYLRTIAMCPRCKSRFELLPHRNPKKAVYIQPRK